MSVPSLPLCVSDAGWVEMDLLLIYWAQNSRQCFQSSPYGGLRGKSRVTAWSRNGIKNVSTETGPGDDAELRWRWPQFRCRPTASKNFPAVQSLQKTKNKNKRLPESVAGRYLRQLGEIPEPGDGDQLESLCATTVDGVVRVCVSTRSTASLVWVLWRHFRRHGLIVETGTIFTVQHLRFSVVESAGVALLETVSGGLLWSVKPKGWT